MMGMDENHLARVSSCSKSQMHCAEFSLVYGFNLTIVPKMGSEGHGMIAPLLATL